LQAQLDEVARSLINHALQQSGHRKSAAAKLLGFANHQTLANWMKRLGMNVEPPHNQEQIVNKFI